MHIHNPNSPPPIDELRVSKLNQVMERGRYTWEKKYATVAIYLKCGSLRETERNSGVPATTIENWRKSSWWDQIVSEIKKAQHAEQDNKLTQIITKALGKIEDILDNGELILNNKTGELVRKPVGIRDATRAASELMQRQESLNKTLAFEEVQKQTVDETLKYLASEFAKMVTKKPEVIDMEDATYAVHEKREEGLQEGSSSVHEQT
jgi:hypothetical protein